jgi:hypothetical protein
MVRVVLKAGVVYALMTFAAGFLLGSVRTFAVAPHLGETAAVALEVPVILAISWLLTGWNVQWYRVGRRVLDRALMGAVAFLVLMTCEMALAVYVFGRGFSDELAKFRTPAGALGLGAQLIFATFPLLRLARARR